MWNLSLRLLTKRESLSNEARPKSHASCPRLVLCCDDATCERADLSQELTGKRLPADGRNSKEAAEVAFNMLKTLLAINLQDAAANDKFAAMSRDLCHRTYFSRFAGRRRFDCSPLCIT